jgi:acyl transferase domain-containing protein
VSAFGISGTNAHVIVEEAPAVEPGSGESAPGTPTIPVLDDNRPSAVGREVPREGTAQAPLAWLLSGQSATALSGQARELADFVATRPDLRPADVAVSLLGRTLLEHRAVVRGRSRDELLAGLTALAEGRDGITGKAARPKVGFVFAGQGAQKVGMGRELYAVSPVFAEAFDRAAGLVEAELGHSIRDVVLGGDEEDGRADRTLYAQTGLFAVEIGLLAVLTQAGVTPGPADGRPAGRWRDGGDRGHRGRGAGVVGRA